MFILLRGKRPARLFSVFALTRRRGGWIFSKLRFVRLLYNKFKRSVFVCRYSNSHANAF